MLSTFIWLPFVIKIFVLSIFEKSFYTGLTVFTMDQSDLNVSNLMENFIGHKRV